MTARRPARRPARRDDPLAPARGITYGLLFSCVLWALIGLAVTAFVSLT